MDYGSNDSPDTICRICLNCASSAGCDRTKPCTSATFTSCIAARERHNVILFQVGMVIGGNKLFIVGIYAGMEARILWR